MQDLSRGAAVVAAAMAVSQSARSSWVGRDPGEVGLWITGEGEHSLMFARIGVMRALNRRVERVFTPDRKDSRGKAEAQERSVKPETELSQREGFPRKC
jgi:hypothetical protein